MTVLIEVGKDTPSEAIRICHIGGHKVEVYARIEDADDPRGRHIVLTVEDKGPAALAAQHEAMAQELERQVDRWQVATGSDDPLAGVQKP